MTLNYELVRVMILLAPGFITYQIISYMAFRKNPTNLGMVFEIFLWSVLSFLSSSLIAKVPLMELVKFETLAGNGKVLLLAFISSIVIGLVFAFILNKRFIYTLPMWLNLTQKTGYQTAWDDVLTEVGGDVLLHMYNGQKFVGTICKFNTYPEKPMLYLTNCEEIVQNVNGECHHQDINAIGLFIINLDHVDYMILMK